MDGPENSSTYTVHDLCSYSPSQNHHCDEGLLIKTVQAKVKEHNLVLQVLPTSCCCCFLVSLPVVGEVAPLDLLALRIDGSRHQRTLASPPPHCWSGSLDLAPQFHGFPEWQLLVVLGQVGGDW